MWLPVHMGAGVPKIPCSESGAETSAEMLLAALLPGLILATFLIQLVQTCLGIVGWLDPPMSINTQEQAHRHSRGQSDGGNSSTDILSSRVCLVGDRSNCDGCLLLFLSTYYFLRQGLPLNVTFLDLSRVVVSELWGFSCFHIPPCPAGCWDLSSSPCVCVGSALADQATYPSPCLILSILSLDLSGFPGACRMCTGLAVNSQNSREWP